MQTEQNLQEGLKKAEDDYKEAKRQMTWLKKQLDNAETKLIESKLAMERVQESIRVFNNTTPKPDTTERTAEIKQFRQDNAELCAITTERDSDKSND